jgi:dephospho-CoA kinase
MIIGLTGGIAAGKSTVRELLATGCELRKFDADSCVRRLLDTEPHIASEIRRMFGPAFLRADDTPDRAQLREAIYGNPDARRRLESLIHPPVRAEWLALRDKCLAEGTDMLADIPLLYETGAESFFDSVVVVGCSASRQLDRLAARGIGRPMGEAMLASQWPIGQKVARADFVIWNDGSLAALGRQTELLANQLFSA